MLAKRKPRRLYDSRNLGVAHSGGKRALPRVMSRHYLDPKVCIVLAFWAFQRSWAIVLHTVGVQVQAVGKRFRPIHMIGITVVFGPVFTVEFSKYRREQLYWQYGTKVLVII